MNVLVVGGGGREHAIVQSLKKSEQIKQLFVVPGNGGIAKDAICAPIDATDLPGIVAYAKKSAIDFAVVAPDDPLVLGAVDMLEEAGVPCFGPNKKAAILEGSKVFAKTLMQTYGIPTAAYATFSKAEEALAYLRAYTHFPVVIKADGLAKGKGVIIAHTLLEAEQAVSSMMQDKIFGESGSHIVIEEYLTGPEVSVLAFTDGSTIVPMLSSMDHKRALDGDEGGNTGGMGAVAPNPYYTDEIAQTCMQRIFLPTIRAMAKENRPFSGCLYFGLMLTGEGPKVIEYNCRFGDPETQVVLPLLETDLLSIMQAVREKRLHTLPISFKKGAACCVILASGGYPQNYQNGLPISINPASIPANATLYHAGTAYKNAKLYTAGGRVIGATATGNSLHEAIASAYEAARAVRFHGMHMRSDIGKSALAAANQQAQ